MTTAPSCKHQKLRRKISKARNHWKMLIRCCRRAYNILCARLLVVELVGKLQALRRCHR